MKTIITITCLSLCAVALAEKPVDQPLPEDAAKQGVMKRLHGEEIKPIIFPSIQLENARLQDVLYYLQIRTRWLHEAEIIPPRKGMDFFMRQSAYTEEPVISELRGKNMSLEEVLERICELTNTTCTVKGRAVTFEVGMESEFPERQITQPRIHLIYDSLRLGDIQDQGTFAKNEIIKVPYSLKNQGNADLIVPIVKKDDRKVPYRDAGIAQYWIERLGADATIPSKGEKTQRRGNQYADGKCHWSSMGLIEMGGALDSYIKIDATELVPGDYEYTVEYKRLGHPERPALNDVIDTKTFRFTVAE